MSFSYTSAAYRPGLAKGASGGSIPDQPTNFLTKFAPLVYVTQQSFRFSSRRPNIKSTERMNKLDLIQALRDATDLTKPEAEKVVTIFFNDMGGALAKGERVEIRGFCSFFVKDYGSYSGRNPKTGERVKIKPKKLPFFKAGKELKERVER
jgi:integration host factor subunit beta